MADSKLSKELNPEWRDADSGRSTPLTDQTDSSCEFVRVTKEDCLEQDKLPPAHSSVASGESADDENEPDQDLVVLNLTLRPKPARDMPDSSPLLETVGGAEAGPTEESDDDQRNIEIQRLMKMLHKRTTSQDSDSDDSYIQLPTLEPLLADETSSSGPMIPRFLSNQPSVNHDDTRPPANEENRPYVDTPVSLSDWESETEASSRHDPSSDSTRSDPDEPPPDPDDRVESDMSPEAPSPVTEPVTTPPDVTIRHYRHLPNPNLNERLTTIALLAIGFAFGLAVGNYLGTSREAYLQHQIQEGQRLRLQAVQDDLLMCLRKQEDIDQTIGKLNEIEAILVDAEHWRNEYEELLKIKLTNEGALRAQKEEVSARLQVCLSGAASRVASRDPLDRDVLERQETTLNSVWEKLDGSLIEKDHLIHSLQERLSVLSVNLTSCENMRDAYMRSHEDKSYVNLRLREEIFALEREMFDIRVGETSDCVPRRPDIEPSAPTVKPTEETPSTKNKPLHKQKRPTPSQTEENLPEEPKEVSNRSNEVSKPSAVATPPKHIDLVHTDIVGSINNSLLAQLDNVTHLYTLSLKENAIFKTKVEELERRLNESNLTLSSCLSFTLGYDPVASFNITAEQLTRLHSNVKQHAADTLIMMSNITSGTYTNLKSRMPELNITMDGESLQGYINETKTAAKSFLDKVDSTWYRVKNATSDILDSKQAKKIRSAVNKGLKKMASGFNEGFEMFNNVMKYSKSTKPEKGKAGEPRRDPKKSKNGNHQQPMDGVPPVEGKEREPSPSKRDRLMLTSDMKRVQRTVDDFLLQSPQSEDDVEDIIETIDELTVKLPSDPSVSRADLLFLDCQHLWWNNFLVWKFEEPGLTGFYPDDCQQVLSYLQLDHSSQRTADWMKERAESREFERNKPDDWFWRRADYLSSEGI